MPHKTCACQGHTLDRLLQPTVMALLAEEPLHGYALINRLKDSPLMQGNPPDPSGIYRMLNSLEKQGLIEHKRSKSKEGPEKRQFQLNASGKECLELWIEVLDSYQQNVARLVTEMRRSASK